MIKIPRDSNIRPFIYVAVIMAISAAFGFFVVMVEPAPDPPTTPIFSPDVKVEAPPVRDSAELYVGDFYSFYHRPSGWTLTEERYDVEDTEKITPVLRSDDWEQTGMGLDDGAEVSVTMAPLAEGQTLNSLYSNLKALGATDMQGALVDDVTAFTANLDYEGLREVTTFIYNDTVYSIIFTYSDAAEGDENRVAYDEVVKTFQLSNKE